MKPETIELIKMILAILSIIFTVTLAIWVWFNWAGQVDTPIVGGI